MDDTQNNTNRTALPQEESGSASVPSAGAGAPCVEYGHLPRPVDWDSPVNTPETFAALVAEHRAWHRYIVARETKGHSPAEMVAALRAGYESAMVMMRAQIVAWRSK